LYEQKEEIRKIYDHYELKLQHIISEKEEKIKKGFHLTENFLRKLERVQLLIYFNYFHIERKKIFCC
jgi:hypothetical protein